MEEALLQRQVTTPMSTASSSATGPSASRGSSTTSSTSASSSPNTQTQSNGNGLLQIGPYQCSSSLDLPFLFSVLADYLQTSSTTLAATTTFLRINLHAAASSDNPDEPAQALAEPQMPASNNVLSNVMNANLSSYLYTPEHLQQDRANLNDTWYNAAIDRQPDTRYYNTVIADGDVHTTPDGWPSESYIEFQKLLRLIVSFGTVDPQMRNYNFSSDDGTIFPSNYLSSIHDVSYSSNGSLSSGCFVDFQNPTIAATNNSWAESVLDLDILRLTSEPAPNTTFSSIGNLTACGSAALLNNTILDSTADDDFATYRTIPYSTIWTWTTGEPRNVTGEDNELLERCAVLDLSLRGRWRVDDCTGHHYAACRVGGNPYTWAISDQKGSYSSVAESGCGDGQAFALPRTGLENAYLAAAWEAARDDKDGDTALWIDFNSLNRQDCWVVGVNASCPYLNDDDAQRSRTVIVPTVAAVIIFVLSALTLFVKCAANRQNSRRRRRRRGDDGWDYEGVPS